MGEGNVRLLDGNRDGRASGPTHRGPLLLVAVGIVIGAVGSLVLSSVATSGGEVPSTSVPVAATRTSVPAVATSATTATTSTVVTTTSQRIMLSEPSVVPEAGAADLLGEVALTPSPGLSGSGTLYVLRPGGSVVRRDDMPLTPGDYPYPLLMTGGHIAFTGGQSGYLIDTELTDSPRQLSDTSFIVAAAAPGQVWFVGRGAEWVAPVDVVAEETGDRIDVADVFDWPLAGAADGLIVRPVDETIYGPIAYWTPGGGLEPIVLDNPDKSHLIAASGNLAVIVEQDLVRVLDITTGDYLGRPGVVVGGDRLNIEACLSPNQQHLAVVGVTGDAYIMEVNTGVVLHRLTDLQFPHAIGWTDPDQFVFVVGTGVGTTVRAIDVSTGQPHIAAALTGSPSRWLLAANGTMC